MGHELRTLQKSGWKTSIFYLMMMRVWAIDVGVDGEEATSNELMPMTRERQAERADQEGRRCEDGSPKSRATQWLGLRQPSPTGRAIELLECF
ncbi:hypothetical protein C1882_01900 [Pseudomonas sp. FW305-E2]|nr:hypothetical protein C1882_01900 [Pseudomonas sp. FW305-E2]PYB93702.1 hypothetical protein DMX01_04055 [Pseudomonas fulva]PYC16528.1 hypothetical protein DMX00_05650 [Pseudomonas fulva]